MNDQSLEEDYDSLSLNLVTYFPSVSSLSAIDCLTSRASYLFLDAAEVSVCPLLFLPNSLCTFISNTRNEWINPYKIAIECLQREKR